MAKVTFNPNSPIQSLSGTLGNMTFRTLYGRTFVTERAEPVLPKNATREQKAAFKKRSIIDNCVRILQDQMDDIPKAIRLRPTFVARIKYLYKTFENEIQAPTKLQKRIMTEYYQRFDRLTGSQISSVHSR